MNIYFALGVPYRERRELEKKDKSEKKKKKAKARVNVNCFLILLLRYVRRSEENPFWRGKGPRRERGGRNTCIKSHQFFHGLRN